MMILIERGSELEIPHLRMAVGSSPKLILKGGRGLKPTSSGLRHDEEGIASPKFPSLGPLELWIRDPRGTEDQQVIGVTVSSIGGLLGGRIDRLR